MLAVVSPHSDLETIKQLLAHKVDYTVKEKGTNNNLLHLCAERGNSDRVFDYLMKNLNLDSSEANADGETPLSICIREKNAKRIKIAEEVQSTYDKSG